ncbi:MAG: glycosyltransferase family 4 protein [Lacunisphaera sp.]
MPSPTEIIILDDYASTAGGSSSVAIASALGLATRGLPVTYFSCVGPVAPRLRDIPGLTVICLDQPEIARDPHRLRAFWSGLRNARAVRAVRELLAGKDPARTIVHVHTWMKALSPFALQSVAAQDFPLVVTLHDYFIACPNGGFFEYPTGQICRRQPLSLSCLGCNCDRRSYAQKLWRSARTALQNRWLALPGRITHYVGVSDFSAAILRPHLPPQAAVSVVRNPVECVDEGAAPAANNQPFIFVGRLVPEKGVRLFAEAVTAAGVPAIFVGDGELLPELRRLCPAARFTGWLDPVAIRVELRGARALVLPSLWYETLGLVAIEAAAAGVPAIVSDGCAATDYIRHDETGLHFAHGSADALAAAMQAAAVNDTLVARLGAAAYRWYWDNPWTTERHVTDLLGVYRTLRPTAPDFSAGSAA